MLKDKLKYLLLISLLVPSLAFGLNKYGKPEQSAAISASSSGDNTVVAAVTGKRICVLHYNFITAGAVNVRFESGAGGTAKTGLYTIDAASKGISTPVSDECLFATDTSALLNLELSGAVLVGGLLTYIVID